MENSGIKVSVLVYVLNDVSHIEKCVHSVMMQSLRELEILLIDGGSTDGTLEKLRQFMDEDKRIRLVQSAAGVGRQFNAGLDAAVGKYVGICESDDYLLPDMYARQYETAERYGLDIVKADVLRFCENGKKEHVFPFSLTAIQELYDMPLYPQEDLQFIRLGVNGFWSGLYRRTFLMDHRLRMNETDGAAYQDITFSFLTGAYARRAYVMKEAFYCYRMDNPNSSINNPSRVSLIRMEYQMLKEQLRRRGLWEKYKEIYWKWRTDSYLWFYDNLSDTMRAEYVPLLYQDIRNEMGTESYKGTELAEKGRGLCGAAQLSMEGFKDSMENTDAAWRQAQQKIRLLAPEEDVVIFGTGNIGRLVSDYLEQCGKKAVAGIDNAGWKWNRQMDGLRIYSPEEGTRQYPHAAYIIANEAHGQSMQEQLIKLGIRRERIIICKNYDLFLKKFLMGQIKGKQQNSLKMEETMEHEGICGKIFKVRDALQDEQSRILFDARLRYSIDRDKWKLYHTVDLFEKKWHCPVLEDFIARSDGKGIVVWGCGYDGREAKRVLDLCGYHLDFFCDSDGRLAETKVDGVPVLPVDQMMEKCRDYSVIIGSAKYRDEMKDALAANGFPDSRVLCLGFGRLQAATGKMQYFNVFDPEENEVFVDAGAYDGETILDFLKWTGGKYQKVIAIEPLHDMCGHIRSICEQKGIHDVDIREVAAWDREETLCFTENLTGSRVEEQGGITINGLDIDSIVGEDRVTYIKMDIEGSELKALKGAGNVIRKNRPKLAVSLYHKPEDIVELPAYILELVPEYRFYIRHYCSDLCETVLYAVP